MKKAPFFRKLTPYAYWLLSLFLLAVPSNSANAASEEVCLYVHSSGQIKKARSINQVPSRYRSQARCLTEEQLRQLQRNQGNAPYLAKPGEIELDGNIRREKISSPVGEITLRWPRSVETLFGRTPLRATVEAARTLSRAIRQASFPTRVQSLNVDWQIVFMDEDIPESQIPRNLISGCHPGWMTPPANIYIVAQRVAAGCNSNSRSVSTSVADSQLALVLIHEFGHALEYQLLENRIAGNKLRSEGFATWFEKYAANHSSMLNRRRIEGNQKRVARESLKQKPTGSFYFQGSYLDYNRASMYFGAIEEKLGASAITGVYDVMVERRMPFFQAIEKRTGWDTKRLEDEVEAFILK